MFILRLHYIRTFDRVRTRECGHNDRFSTEARGRNGGDDAPWSYETRFLKTILMPTKNLFFQWSRRRRVCVHYNNVRTHRSRGKYNISVGPPRGLVGVRVTTTGVTRRRRRRRCTYDDEPVLLLLLLSLSIGMVTTARETTHETRV